MGRVPVLSEKIVGSCVYKNPLSKLEECTGKGSTLAPRPCAITERLACCIRGGAQMKLSRITFPGADAAQCGSSRRGCEFSQRPGLRNEVLPLRARRHRDPQQPLHFHRAVRAGNTVAQGFQHAIAQMLPTHA